jgi:HB1, ASXL, restriction endonuclease HTH domain
MNDQPNPYDAVIADLRAKRDQIDQMIQYLELFKGGIPILAPGVLPTPSFIGSAYAPSTDTSQIPSGAFLGMGIEEAVRALLRIRKRAMSAQEIAADLLTGGLHLKSETPANTIASVLSRAYKAGGDIVRISRGQWGLREWYPTRRFDRSGED